MLSFFPRDVLDEIWDLIASVSECLPQTLILMPNINLVVLDVVCGNLLSSVRYKYRH